MTTKTKTIDWGGLTLELNQISLGHKGPRTSASSTFTGDAPLSTTLTNSADSPATYLNWQMIAAGAGKSINGANFVTTTAVALGTWANAINGKLDFGSAGSVTGLGGAICAEVDLGAGCTAGSYAPFEAELVLPSGALTGTRTSFLTLNASGADVATLDTNGHLFDLNGVTAGTSKLFASGASIGAVDEITHGLKVLIGGSVYYLLLATAANFTD